MQVTESTIDVEIITSLCGYEATKFIGDSSFLSSLDELFTSSASDIAVLPPYN